MKREREREREKGRKREREKERDFTDRLESNNPANLGHAAQALCDAAIKAHSQDNCAAIVVALGDFVKWAGKKGGAEADGVEEVNGGTPLNSLANLNARMAAPYNPITDDRTATANLPREVFEEAARQMKLAEEAAAKEKAKAEAATVGAVEEQKAS